jgi:hypothetical protein
MSALRNSSMRSRWVAGSMPIIEASDDNASGPMEEHHTVGQYRGVMGGQGDHPGFQANMSCALGSRGDEDLRCGDDPQAGGVVCADPRLFIPRCVGRRVAPDRKGGILTGRVKRSHEDAERAFHEVSLCPKRFAKSPTRLCSPLPGAPSAPNVRHHRPSPCRAYLSPTGPFVLTRCLPRRTVRYLSSRR